MAKYRVIETAKNETVFEAETKIECGRWIRLGDKDSWYKFVCVDENDKPQKLWFMN